MANREIEIYGGEFAALSPADKGSPWKISEINENGIIKGYKVSMAEKDFDDFKASLTMSIVDATFEHYFTKFLKGKLRDGVIESVIENHQHAIQMPQYYFPLTMFILDDYFKNNSKINISTFIRFNMPGLVKEIKSLSTLEASMGGKLINMESRIDSGYGECKNESVQEVIDKMAMGYPEHGDMEANSRISIFDAGGEIMIVNKKFHNVDLEFFKDQTGIDIGFKDDDDGPEGYAMTILILAWEIFKPKSFVIYNSIQGQFRDDIIENVGIFNKNHDEQINLMFSNDNIPHVKPLK